jgi:hypothetical protein
MHKMLLDEYIDLDMLSKDVDRNINDILAILYRPITVNKMNTGTFVLKNTVKVLKNKVENGFDYYEIEKYDNFIREERSPQYDNFPASMALGALGFFLDSKLSLLKSTAFYFPQWESMMSEVKNKKGKMRRALERITVGYMSSTNLLKVPSYNSQAINA